MKGSVRYIITRPCLSEGSVRLLKYLEAVFPHDGPIRLLGDRGEEYAARVDRAGGRVYGLRDLYARHNLGVNDVLLITPLGEDRYQVECVVKPLAERSASPARSRAPEPPQRVVVSESPYVREVRFERRDAAQASPEPASPTTSPQAPQAQPSQPQAAQQAAPAPKPAPVLEAKVEAKSGAEPKRTAPNAAGSTSGADAAAPAAPTSTASTVPMSTVPTNELRAAPKLAERPSATELARPLPTPEPPTRQGTPEEMLRDLARIVGYQVETRAEGLLHLRADLGPQSYGVLIALNLAATRLSAWSEQSETAYYRAVLVPEHERPQGLARLTWEALAALIENARLASLTPLELRGYWNAGSFDLESVASIVELVSAQLSARGVFSFVLLSLAQHEAHSVVSSARLAERLGSGVNPAELARVLETLCAAPFMALSPLGGGLYYLRADVAGVLRGLSEYAGGLRARLNAETRAVALAR